MQTTHRESTKSKIIEGVAPGVLEGVGLTEPREQQQKIQAEEEQLIKELGERGMLTQPGPAGRLGKSLINAFMPSRKENYDRRALIEATAMQIAQDRGDNLGLTLQQKTVFSTGAPAQKIFRDYLRKVLDEIKARPLAVPSSYANHPADNKPPTHFCDMEAARRNQPERSDEPQISSFSKF